MHGTLALVLDGWTISVTYLQWPKKPTLIFNPILPIIQHSILIQIDKIVSIVPNKNNADKSLALLFNVLNLYDSPLCIHSARLHPPSKGFNRHYYEKISTRVYLKVIVYFICHQGFSNYKLMCIGDTNHSFLGAYGPGSQFVPQERFPHFFSSILNLSVSPSDTGMVETEGVAYNWLKRQFVFCGGHQVHDI